MIDQALPQEMAVTPPQFGVDHVKAVLKFVIELGQGMDKSLADGKLGVSDAANFFAALMDASAAFEGLKAFGPELAHLNEVELGEIKQYVNDQLHLQEAHLEVYIKRGLGLALDLYEFIVDLKGAKA